MAQSKLLLQSLKQQLKLKGISYRQVAQHLAISEASVKRLFSVGSMSLERLERICDLAAISLVELANLADQNRRQIDQLTLEQEQDIAADLALLMVAVSVINGFSFTDLLAYYKLDEHHLIRLLVKLDRLKLIELQPGNRIRLLISPHFHWQACGPIQKFFLEKVVGEFFASQFSGDSEKLLVLNGLFGEISQTEIQQLIDELALNCADLIKRDSALPMIDKKGSTLVLAVRQWRFPLFNAMLRD